MYRKHVRGLCITFKKSLAKEMSNPWKFSVGKQTTKDPFVRQFLFANKLTKELYLFFPI